METTSTGLNLKARLQCLISYQDILARNYLLTQRNCDQEFHAFLKFHDELRRKYLELRTQADQMDRSLEEYRTELARKDKKIQSQSAQILRLTQENRRNQTRLNEFQRYLDEMKENKNGPPSLDMLRDMLKDSLISEGEATTDLSDKNCTGDELDNENVQVLQNIPKVVSQSNGIGTIKHSLNSESRLVGRVIGRHESNDVGKTQKIVDSPPYAGIAVGRIQPGSSSVSRPSLTVDKRPKQKVRKPSKEFLSHKSEESELSTDDIFWSKKETEAGKNESPTKLYPTLPKSMSPLNEQKTLTPSTPMQNIPSKQSPIHPSPIRARAHHFLSRNILIPEMCCVCLKRINFGKLAYRCQACAALCHTGCKENCSTLCLPNVKTPNRGAVSKFSPRESTQLQVPALIIHCVKEIEQRGLQEVGLYRLTVVESQVKDLKEKILKSRTGLFDLSHYQDIHLICGVVKDFLRSLSEPLLTNVLWKSFATIIDEESESIKQEKIDSLLHQLPKPNRDTLAFLILHLQRVASSPLCRMSILNLSRTMGPAIIGYSSKHVTGVDIVGETYKQTKLLEYFLKLSSDYWSKFLAEIPESLTKYQIGTPVLIRHQVFNQTPTTTYPSAANQFFSPL